MVLKKHIVFMRASTDPAEDIAFHEIIDIRPEPIYDIVVVPNVHLSHDRERLHGVQEAGI